MSRAQTALSLTLCLAAGCTDSGVTPADIGPPDQTETNVDDASEINEIAADAAASDDGVTADIPGPAWQAPDAGDLARHVDPFIGTGGSGNTFPGAALPHGVVRVGPDSLGEDDRVSAYRDGDLRIEGFTHTQLNGPGGSHYGYSEILLMPVLGPDVPTTPDARAATFDAESHTASPGSYSVTLGSGIAVELTATAWAGLHRYTFPKPPAGEQARVIIDLSASLGDPAGANIEQVDDRTLRGSARFQVHPLLSVLIGPSEPTGDRTVFFHITFDRPFSEAGTFELGGAAEEGVTTASALALGAWAEFDLAEGGVVESQVGLSFIDTAGALRNLEAGVVGRSFDTVRDDARAIWNRALARLVATGGEDLLTMIYTGLYHALLSPTDYTETDARYSAGLSGKLDAFDAGGRRYYADDWCAWDTFRTSHPLETLLQPDIVDDIAASYVHTYDQGGWLDKCSWAATGYSRVMIGQHGVAILSDFIAKGFNGFDRERAYEAMRKSTVDNNDNALMNGTCGYLSLGTVPDYIALGYVPDECDHLQSASMTLETAFDDWTVARTAQSLGKSTDAAAFLARSGHWRNVWDEDTGFMRPKAKDGSWRTPFDPADAAAGSGFAESNAWAYLWFVPHDLPALIAVLGGPSAFMAKLDTFFEEGHYDVSNEPAFHAPWLYAAAGAPDRGNARIHEIVAKSFSTRPEGIPGNDDSGAMSAWLVLAAIGLYPGVATPDLTAEPVWWLSAPLVDHATLHLNPAHLPGRTFTIDVVRSDRAHTAVASATLDGAALETSWLRHSQITAGGTLRIELGPGK